MEFRLVREHGALNSPLVFDAFERGVRSLGYRISKDLSAVPVIWSVLWQGRMLPNKKIYDYCRKNNLPVIIIEVGNFKRGLTWRISINHVNAVGNFGSGPVDKDRGKKLGVQIMPLRQHRNPKILIACQHRNSQQWEDVGMSLESWVIDQITKIRKLTSREIVVRPHPRCPLRLDPKLAFIETPIKVPNTYDDFNIDYDYHCVINYNSGPGVMAAINGTPIICDKSGLAYPVSENYDNIENLCLPDREDWFIDLCHKEWTIDEIEKGVPLSRLIPYLESNNH